MIMDLRRLRYFVATSEELHFGRAAKRLGMSQLPLSMQIRALERELGVTLFDRDRRNVALTVAGEVLLCETRRILAALDHAKLVRQRAAQGLHGALSVGFITPAEYSFLAAPREDISPAVSGRHAPTSRGDDRHTDRRAQARSARCGTVVRGPSTVQGSPVR